MPPRTKRTRKIKRGKKPKVKKVRKRNNASLNQTSGTNQTLNITSIAENAPQNWNQNMLSDFGRTMQTGSQYRDVLGKSHSNKSDYVSAQKTALNQITIAGQNELANPTAFTGGASTTRDRNFVDGNQMIGAMTGDFTTGSVSGADALIGAQRSFDMDPSQTTPGGAFKPTVGARAVAGVDVNSGGLMRTGVSSKQLRQDMGGSIRNMTQMGEDGTVFDFVSGATGSEEQDVMDKAREGNKYSPIKIGSSSTRDFDRTSNDVKRIGISPTSSGGTARDIYKIGDQTHVKKITKVAPEYVYSDNLKKDAYTKLSVEETISPMGVNRVDKIRKGSGKSSGDVGVGGKNKVVKFKGETDLDMDGQVGNTRLERNAKTFGGLEKVYSTRGAARREIKGRQKAKDADKVIGKKDFKYYKTGITKNPVSVREFQGTQTHNVDKFNTNQKAFNAAHMNAGIPFSALQGKQGYASTMGVDKKSAFGTGPVKGLSKSQQNINTNQKKYQKLQKRLDSKVLGRFYKK